ncbi:MAG: hypothetical protein OEY97_06580 [Nitrospirota bacterium]|nr:hypothetical protein [Nitrospirota bacterium]
MPTQINYVLKVHDAKLGQVKKALTDAGIDVVSLVEVYKEEKAAEGGEQAPSAAG